jgi:hypothetical protein
MERNVKAFEVCISNKVAWEYTRKLRSARNDGFIKF